MRALTVLRDGAPAPTGPDPQAEAKIAQLITDRDALRKVVAELQEVNGKLSLDRAQWHDRAKAIGGRRQARQAWHSPDGTAQPA